MRNPTDGAENGLSGEQGNVVNAFWSNVEPKEELWAQDDEDAPFSPDPTIESFPASANAIPPTTVGASRKLKRKLNALGESNSPSPAPAQIESRSVAQPPMLVPTTMKTADEVDLFYSIRNHPVNKSGFRYIPCSPCPSSTPLSPMYRVIKPSPGVGVRFSWEDRSPFVYITADATSVTTDKGFRAARANCPMRTGCWYFEVVVERGGGDGDDVAGSPSKEAHVRIGVGRRESALGAPVGYDAYSYGIRDKTGEKVTLSQPKSYGPALKTGDVVGVLLSLPERGLPSPEDTDDPAHIVRKRIPILYKGQLYFEALEYPVSPEMSDLVDAAAENDSLAKKKQVRQKAAAPGTKAHSAGSKGPKAPRHLPVLSGSSLSFFRNGENMDPQSLPAFCDLYDWLPLRQHRSDVIKKKPGRTLKPLDDRENHHDDGTMGYYPFVSVYGGGIVKLNAGPVFRCPPNTDLHDWRPLSERYDEYFDEVAEQDEIDELKMQEKVMSDPQLGATVKHQAEPQISVDHTSIEQIPPQSDV